MVSFFSHFFVIFLSFFGHFVCHFLLFFWHLFVIFLAFSLLSGTVFHVFGVLLHQSNLVAVVQLMFFLRPCLNSFVFGLAACTVAFFQFS